ncbi:MAG: hypothetical protein ABI574_01985 [Burkholderiales bacterium]
MRVRFIGLSAFVLAMAGCGGGSTPTLNSDVSVAATGPAVAYAGSNATFSVTVANAGPDAANTVSITQALSAGYSVSGVTCTASGGATCPSGSSFPLSIPTLPASGTLTLVVTVPVPVGATGSLTSTTTASALSDGSASNNTATATASAQTADTRNGSYTVYAADARTYALDVNFNESTYTLSGNGLNQSGSFTADGAGTTFTISGNAKFRTAEDLVVGGLDFGSGVKPFVAARNFVTTVAELTGAFNLFGIDVSSTGVADSRIGQMGFGSGTMRVCTNTGIFTIGACPIGSVSTYALTVSGTEFTGVDSVHTDTTKFRVAKSGVVRIFLRANNSSDGSGARRFRLGLPETSGLAGGTFVGATGAAAWGTTVLTSTQYSFSGGLAGGSAVTDSATLAGLLGAGPTGIKLGARSSDSANVFVMQNAPVAALIGARSGVAAGHIEISVP